MIQRKCPSCGSWETKGKDHCGNCGALISPEKILVEEFESREKFRNEVRDTPLENFFDRWKNTPNPLLKFVYFVLRSVWIVYMAILAFFLWLIAMTPG